MPARRSARFSPLDAVAGVLLLAALGLLATIHPPRLVALAVGALSLPRLRLAQGFGGLGCVMVAWRLYRSPSCPLGGWLLVPLALGTRAALVVVSIRLVLAGP